MFVQMENEGKLSLDVIIQCTGLDFYVIKVCFLEKFKTEISEASSS